MENTTNPANEAVTVPVTEVSTATPVTEATAPVATKAPARKSLKGKWGKVGAPPVTIKYPRTAFTISQLLTLNPNVCELTLRNRVIDSTRGYKMVKKMVDGKKVETKVPVEQTLVRLEKNISKETVGRPNFRYLLKSVHEANLQRTASKRAPKNIVAPSPTTPVAAEVA